MYNIMGVGNNNSSNSNNNSSHSILLAVTQSRDDVNNGPKPFSPAEIFVSNEVRQASEIVVDLCLSFVVANVGVVSNVIIILVFAKQGYKESMNVSMTAIATWDLIRCLAASLQRMYGPISLVSAAKAKSWENVSTVSMTYLITFVSYVSSALAAYVAVERCLCVSMPLLVKILLTPKTTFIAMTSLSVGVFGAFAVIFAIFDVHWVYDPTWDQEIIVYEYSQFYKDHKGPLMMYYNLSGIVWPTLSFLIIVVCTTIIVIQLRKASKFRSKTKSSSSSGGGGGGGESSSTISDRDKHVMKMLVVIIAIYIICIFPRIALYYAKYFVEELYFLKKYHNIFMVICHFIFLFDFLNATMNLYVFLTMSSNFKSTAKDVLCFGGKKKK